MTPLETYLSGLIVTQGRRAGEALAVLPWQRKFIAGAFKPGRTTAALSVARGNGKSTLVAGIAAATLDGPLAGPRAETIIVASSFAQAGVAFDHVCAFMGDKLRDRKRYRFWQTGQLARIVDRETGASVRAIGSDPKRAHGLAPSLILADEPAQWPSSSGDRMLAALRTSMGKQPGARLIALGTKPALSEHWFSKMLSGTADYAQCHAAAPDDSPFQRRTWAKGNPSLGHLPDLEAVIRSEAGHAKTDPSVLHEFRSLRLNLGTSEVAEAILIEAGTWARIEGEAEQAGPLIWGCDLGTSAAMSAICAFWPETGRLETVAAFPVEPPLAERGLRDGVGNLYVETQARGELILVGRRAVDLDGLLIEALSRFGRPNVIAADRWREAELRDALDKAGVPPAALEIRGQGFRDGGEDVRGFRRAILEGKVTPKPTKLLRFAMGEARVLMDPAGNAKLAKRAEGGRRSTARDDAAAAAILAVAAGARRSTASPPRRRRHALVG